MHGSTQELVRSVMRKLTKGIIYRAQRDQTQPTNSVARQFEKQPVVIRDTASLVEGKGARGKTSAGKKKPRPRSPLECQCSCHGKDGRDRTLSRGRGRSSDSGSSSRRRSKSGGRSSSSSSRRRGSKSGGRSGSSSSRRRGSKSGGRSGRSSSSDSKSGRDSDDSRNPVNIRDKDRTTRGKGGGFSNVSSPRGGSSKAGNHSAFSTSTNASGARTGKKKRPPFKLQTRPKSAGDATRSMKGNRRDYDYGHEDFLTGPYTSEYKARYEMRMGQRYTVNHDDKSIRFIDPAGEHVLVPKLKNNLANNLKKSNSDPNLSRNRISNVKLEPLDQKKTVNGNKGAAPDRRWVSPPSTRGTSKFSPDGSRKQSNSLPPLEKTPSLRSPSSKSSYDDDVHPLGLNTPPHFKSRLVPMKHYNSVKRQGDT